MPLEPERAGEPALGQMPVGPQAPEVLEEAPVVPASVDEVDAGESDAGEATPAGEEPASETSAPEMGVAPVVQGDWLASVCPYLASDDGTYRSAAPEEGHRCTAQDPAATLPLAFQERFCLTDRHPRCEMYKFAQETDASGAIPAAQVPPTEPPTPRTRRASGRGPGRPAVMAGAGIGALVLIVVLVLLVSSCGGDGGPTADPEASIDPQSTETPAEATPTPEPTPEPTPVPEPTPEPEADATPLEGTGDGTDAATADDIRIQYEIQPDEALRKVAETFGISRNRIRRENPGLEDISPADMPGTILELPISGDMTLEEAQALPGFIGIAP